MATSKNVDVLIVGAGPAGLIAALWMARCGVKTLLIDQREAHTRGGMADGVQARTLEILDSFGLAGPVWDESYHMGEMCLWSAGEDGEIRRESRMPNTVPRLSYFRQGVVLAQHRIEGVLLASLKKYKNVEIQRRAAPVDLQYEAAAAEDEGAHPITVRLQQVEASLLETEPRSKPARNGSMGIKMSDVALSRMPQNPMVDDTEDFAKLDTAPEEQIEIPSHTRENVLRQINERSTQIMKAKYMIGCDGAHSWTRTTLGIEMHNEQTDSVWAVIDIVPITNFPGVRSRCAIRSAKSGSIMLIPREGKLIRLYCQLNEEHEGQVSQLDRSTITKEMIFRKAQEIFRPYTLEYKHCDNWTVYQVGQRVGERFSVDNRIFLAGDAVHTHSPKAGQGMNVSMQDTYTLGWKLALVVQGYAHRNLLSTYEEERKPIADELIAFDKVFSKLWSSRDRSATPSGESAQSFKDALVKQKLFSSGLGVKYDLNVLTAKSKVAQPQQMKNIPLVDGKQSLAPNIPLGQRFPSARVINHSDARPWEFVRWLKADGRFRIIIFAGNVSDKSQLGRVHRFCSALDPLLKSKTSIGGRTVGSVIDILTIHTSSRDMVELADFPELLHPFDEAQGWGYDKIFVDEASYYEPHGEAYRKYGINKQRGCVVVTRPDQHVGWIGDLEDTSELQSYFEGFLAISSYGG